VEGDLTGGHVAGLFQISPRGVGDANVILLAAYGWCGVRAWYNLTWHGALKARPTLDRVRLGELGEILEQSIGNGIPGSAFGQA
jgi:hypothetical protein